MCLVCEILLGNNKTDIPTHSLQCLDSGGTWIPLSGLEINTGVWVATKVNKTSVFPNPPKKYSRG
jgi:hypothetical protein